MEVTIDPREDVEAELIDPSGGPDEEDPEFCPDPPADDPPWDEEEEEEEEPVV